MEGKKRQKQICQKNSNSSGISGFSIGKNRQLYTFLILTPKVYNNEMKGV